MATPEADDNDVVYKTKIVEFLGRPTSIILQNDNGPCPLLAICNALLLRNNFNLGPDASEVPLQKLLSVLADRLLDSNSNVQDKDEEYISNQQQNIMDAIELLPRLATGIDVNVQFRKVNDFEFTRECTIFDLLDIGLYHGWIVDPQDSETAEAIGSKSYNTLVGELVAFETMAAEREDTSIQEEDSVDFAAATTATLGVPSPSLSRGISFEDCPVSVALETLGGKGDREEETELTRALHLSRTEISNPTNQSMLSLSSEGITYTKSTGSVILAESSLEQIVDVSEKAQQPDLFEPREHNSFDDCKEDGIIQSGELLISSDSTENVRTDMPMSDGAVPCQATNGDGSNGCNSYKNEVISAGEDLSVTQPCNEDCNKLIDSDSPIFPCPADAPSINTPSLDEEKELTNISEVVASSLEASEPIYEGEEHILDSGHPVFEDREPVYEGEMVLAQQADKKEEEDACSINSKHALRRQWQLIKSFLENNASQLTIYGLFCLQEGLRERELCVFFRNNHFSTMFKFNGELYLLATDQGYINQPDLVWEKLNEVNGDTVFMTGNFLEFKASENRVNDTWNEQSAMTSTADFLATFEGSSPSSSAMNSDLQLAIALQQQEFEQQPQRHQQQSQQQQPSISGRSQLVTGPPHPQAPPRSSSSAQKSEMKTKCVVM